MPNPNIRFPILRRLVLKNHSLFPGEKGDGLDWIFEPGVTVIAGINGIGKTTLLNLVYRLLVGPFDPFKDDDGIQITRTRLVKLPVFRYFSGRDAGAATNARSTAEFTFGEKTLSICRRLSDLTIESLLIAGEPTLSSDDLESSIWKLSGCASQYDFHLIVRTLLFFMEQKAPVIWDPSAQAEIFRILFLDSVEAYDFAQLASKIQKMDSLRRNKIDQLNRYKKQSNKFHSQASVATEVVNRTLEIDTRLKIISSLADDLADRADSLERDRDDGRQKLDGLKLDIEEATRKVEDLHHHYFASLFPTLTETAKNVLTNLVSNNGCHVCGNREPELGAKFRALAENGDCPICRSPKEKHEQTFAVTQFGSESIQNELARVSALKTTVSELETDVFEKSRDYMLVLRERLELNVEKENLRSEYERLRGMLPPSAEQAAETEKYIKYTEKEVSELLRDIETEMESYKSKASFFRKEVESLRENLTSFFAEYAANFLAESCQLTFDPRKLAIGQATEKVEFPTFSVQMTSAVSPSAGTTRSDADEVSESQKEFIDLAFRMAVLKTYAITTKITCSAMIVIETPEASLDSIFIENAGKMLRDWCRPTKNGANSIVATSNLNRENMIPALLGLGPRNKIKPPAQEIQKRVINLLTIAAENASLRAHRTHYLNEFKKATTPQDTADE